MSSPSRPPSCRSYKLRRIDSIELPPQPHTLMHAQAGRGAGLRGRIVCDKTRVYGSTSSAGQSTPAPTVACWSCWSLCSIKRCLQSLLRVIFRTVRDWKPAASDSVDLLCRLNAAYTAWMSLPSLCRCRLLAGHQSWHHFCRLRIVNSVRRICEPKIWLSRIVWLAFRR